MEEISPKIFKLEPLSATTVEARSLAAVASLGYGETIPLRTFRLDDSSDQIRQVRPVMSQSHIPGIGWGSSLYQMQIATNLTRQTFLNKKKDWPTFVRSWEEYMRKVAVGTTDTEKMTLFLQCMLDEIVREVRLLQMTSPGGEVSYVEFFAKLQDRRSRG